MVDVLKQYKKENEATTHVKVIWDNHYPNKIEIWINWTLTYGKIKNSNLPKNISIQNVII